MIAMPTEPSDPSLSLRLCEFHAHLQSTGSLPNTVLSLMDDPLLYLVALIRDALRQASSLLPKGWQVFLDILRPHRVYHILAYHLHLKQEDCRPAKITEYLNRLFLNAAAPTV